MHGSAKYSTKAFSPGIALSGSTPRCAASQPQSTSAKNGTVTARMACMLGRSIARPGGARATAHKLCGCPCPSKACMSASRPGFFGRWFGRFWRLLDGTRRLLLNLLFLALIVGADLGLLRRAVRRRCRTRRCWC